MLYFRTSLCSLISAFGYVCNYNDVQLANHIELRTFLRVPTSGYFWVKYAKKLLYLVIPGNIMILLVKIQ